ncbi:(2Fe-2S)-binding protein [Paradesertivirga mongoliensis]|uniref:(2Fe-2S)-binding protein n=1 Tax=Paradesertivirga mongoliensis TaxID=2100740 RepID=A0ABW4ZQJ4_9SPHI|nr:(2Fe-2S)-binding protein [Pedobacter mongoliensis]
MAKYTLIVNGIEQGVDVDPAMPLLWILRDELNLTGTKYSCGVGVCGACTVLVDGQAFRSCQLTAAFASGKKITTIEGLSDEVTHPVQQAWEELNVPQCGYCQSGQMLAAAALLSKNPKPQDSIIDQVMSQNICRCGTHYRIKKAIHRASEIAAKKG